MSLLEWLFSYFNYPTGDEPLTHLVSLETKRQLIRNVRLLTARACGVGLYSNDLLISKFHITSHFAKSHLQSLSANQALISPNIPVTEHKPNEPPDKRRNSRVRMQFVVQLEFDRDCLPRAPGAVRPDMV